MAVDVAFHDLPSAIWWTARRAILGEEREHRLTKIYNKKIEFSEEYCHSIDEYITSTDDESLQVVTNYHKKALCSYMMILMEMEHLTSSFRCTTVVHENRVTIAGAHILPKVTSSLDVGRYVCPGLLPNI